MNSTKRFANSLIVAAATALSLSVHAQPTFTSIEHELFRAESGELLEKDRHSRHRRPAIVGMWITTYYIGAFKGPDTPRLDLAIQQFSSDGNELMSSALTAPEVGNVCFGAWKDLGHNSFKVRHVGWDFADPAVASVSAIFRLNVSLTVSPDGSAYTGTYTTDLTDLNGNPLPGTFAEGDVRATRFEVDGTNAVDLPVMGKVPESGGSSRRKSC